MRLKINETITINEREADIIVEYPTGFRARLPKERLSLIAAFDPPATLQQVGADLPEQEFRAWVGELQDLTVLVPDDPYITPWPLPADLLFDGDSTFREILRVARGYTMGTPELCYALFDAVRYIHNAGIDGAIVESGVWRGGNVALCALTLLRLGDTSRDLYMFDTFDWSWPTLTRWDTKLGQGSVEQREAAMNKRRNASAAALDSELVTEARVREYVAGTGYPAERIVSVKGLVQETLPEHAPGKIALLRLDTDLYESTYHELVHLYPRLVSGGVLLIDDYPTEHGCVQAVEQYFGEVGARPLLSRIHTQGRIGIKP